MNKSNKWLRGLIKKWWILQKKQESDKDQKFVAICLRIRKKNPRERKEERGRRREAGRG